MSAATKYAVKKNLQELVPLNELSESSFKEIAPKIVIEEVRSGHYLFRKGDHDNQSVYLLDGKIDLIDDRKKVTGEIEAGTDISRYPVANQQPRTLSARAVSKVIIARIDSILIDAYLNWDHSSVADATEIIADDDDDEDWMTRILKSEAFIRIPPAIIQRLIISMQPFPVCAGDVVIHQGEEGDYFYSIHKGRCAVTRRESPDGKDMLLSELSSGDFFGEESLLHASKRNATITMLTDGLLMRLGKKDFIELLQKPLVKSVSYEEASSMVEEGAVWIDVRTETEYASHAIEDSVNIPLNELRDQIPELVFNAKYVICCDTGHRSISASFVLSHKGFESYVLDGGLNALKSNVGAQTHQGRSGDAGNTEASRRQGAEIFAFKQSRNEDVGGDTETTSERRLSGDECGPPDAGQLAELEFLRGEIKALKQVEKQRQETGNQLLELQTKVDIQQDIIRESDLQADALRLELETVSGEKRQLHERHDAALESHAKQLERVEHELEQSRELVASLRTEIATVEQGRRQLQEVMGSSETDNDARFARLEDELSRIRRQRDDLQEEFDAGREHAVHLETEYASYRNEQILVQEKLQEELAQAQRRFELLHAELLQKAQQHSESETGLQQQLRTVESLNKDLAESRRQQAALEAELAAEREQRHAQDQDAGAELAQRLAELESLREELVQSRERENQLTDGFADQENEVRNVRLQLEDLTSRYEEQQTESSRRSEQLQQQLDALLAEKQAQDERLASLQQAYESLQGEGERLLLQHKEQSDQVEQLAAGKQAVEDAMKRLQDEWNTERTALRKEIDAGGCRVTDLELLLERSAESAAREIQQLQEEMQSRADAYQEQLEQQEKEREELQKEESHAREALLALTVDRDDLKTRLDQHVQQEAAQQRKIEELTTLVDSLRNAADGHSRELDEQLENVRHRADVAESQLETLRTELSAQREKEAALLVDVEVLRNQGEEFGGQLQEAEDRYLARELDNQETLNKLYDDLTRKNETERELQGQIERLRKKLDQSEEALQAARHEERESVENIRNELNAERRARAEERAQMAARQRELKEQLVSVASHHEEVIATRDGVVAQARDDAREEERTRLGQVIAMQAQMEQQLATLQNELRQAHEETEAAVRRERANNEADLALARRQKADADAALGQLETQLGHLMEERDAALAERQSVREQLNSLRAEVEVARGLVNAEKQGLAGDPIRLISELKETRRNIEIAVRLRSEAESQRDEALAQLAALHHAQPGADSIDSGPAVTGDPGRESTTQISPAPAMPGLVAPIAAGPAPAKTISTAPAETKTGRVRLGKVWLIGGGTAVLAALAFWLTTRVEIPMVSNPAETDIGPDAAAVATTGAPSREQDAVQEMPVSSDAATAVLPHDTASSSSQLVAEVPQAPAVEKPKANGVEAVRSFRDALAGGGSGPLMVELPAAGYLMGSAGNSLNFEERPQHTVDLHAFAIGKYEVSFAEYDRFAQATGRRLPHDEGWGRDDRPVINVTWTDAVAYTKWLSEQTGHHYRLPSEAEWEFAARGDTTSAFWWDGTVRENPANCFDCGSRWDGTSTAPVGSFQANRFGIHDTSGNVQEWTEDCFHPNYQNAPSDGSAWQSPACTRRVVRGGSYTSPLDSVRSARRGQYEQDTRLDNIGFRVVRVDL